jgi:hypothetical protein
MKESLQQNFFKKESIIFFAAKKEGKTFDTLRKLTFKHAPKICAISEFITN